MAAAAACDGKCHLISLQVEASLQVAGVGAILCSAIQPTARPCTGLAGRRHPRRRLLGRAGRAGRNSCSGGRGGPSRLGLRGPGAGKRVQAQ